MVTEIDKSMAQKTFAFVGEALLVSIVAFMPVCIAMAFAVVVTGL
jgi:hypothetical protein